MTRRNVVAAGRAPRRRSCARRAASRARAPPPRSAAQVPVVIEQCVLPALEALPPLPLALDEDPFAE
jgi:hypothetical protein